MNNELSEKRISGPAGTPEEIDGLLNELLDQLSTEESAVGTGETRLSLGLDLGLEQEAQPEKAAVRLDLGDLLGQAGVQEKLVDLLIKRFKLPGSLAMLLAQAILDKSAKKPTRRMSPRKTTAASAKTARKAKPKKRTTASKKKTSASTNKKTTSRPKPKTSASSKPKTSSSSAKKPKSSSSRSGEVRQT